MPSKNPSRDDSIIAQRDCPKAIRQNEYIKSKGKNMGWILESRLTPEKSLEDSSSHPKNKNGTFRYHTVNCSIHTDDLTQQLFIATTLYFTGYVKAYCCNPLRNFPQVFAFSESFFYNHCCDTVNKSER